MCNATGRNKSNGKRWTVKSSWIKKISILIQFFLGNERSILNEKNAYRWKRFLSLLQKVESTNAIVQSTESLGWPWHDKWFKDTPLMWGHHKKKRMDYNRPGRIKFYIPLWAVHACLYVSYLIYHFGDWSHSPKSIRNYKLQSSTTSNTHIPMRK